MTPLLASLLLLACSAHAVLDIANTQPKVSASAWNPILDKTWEGIKKRNIQAYTTGLVHRPKSETPGDAVSEGVGYGMLVALYANDQAGFNSLWEAGNQHMWNGRYYDWRVNKQGTVTGTGAATDAEEDIALSLIFASKLVEKNIWSPYTSTELGVSYEAHAQTVLNSMWSTRQITSTGILAPGAGWGGEDFVNAGYFSPAWYRVFADFDSNKVHDWAKVIDKSYDILEASPFHAQGMIPDWCKPDGGFVSSGLGYNPYLNGHAFFKDAIRILWRISLDALWFGEPRAKTFLENSMAFLRSKGGAPAANFYQLEGDSLGLLVPEADKWMEFNDSSKTETWRWRREHSHLTIGMWGTAAMVAGNDLERIAFSQEMSKYYEKKANADFFGKILDTNAATLEDTLHNEMYFDQFLAWFGMATMTGVFNNVAENLSNPVQATPGIDFDPFPTALRPTPEMGNNSLRITNGVAYAPEGWDASTRWTLYNLDGKAQELGMGKSVALPRGQGLGILQARHGSHSLSQRYMDL